MKEFLIYLQFNGNSTHNALSLILICILIIVVCYFVGYGIDLFKKPVKNLNFSDNHPYLNMIQGLSFLLILSIFVMGLIIFLVKAIIKVFRASSKLDSVIVVAMITGFLSIVGNVGSKFYEQKKKREEYLAQKREKSYGQFVDMIYKLQNSVDNPDTYTEENMKKDLSKFSKEITLWGSSNVVKKWDEFRLNGNISNNGNNNLFLIEEIINAMRKDLGVKKTKKGDLLAFFVNDIKEILNQEKNK